VPRKQKLNRIEKDFIRKVYAAGKTSMLKLALHFAVSTATIHRAVHDAYKG
jgi:hypothetical protein